MGNVTFMQAYEFRSHDLYETCMTPRCPASDKIG